MPPFGGANILTERRKESEREITSNRWFFATRSWAGLPNDLMHLRLDASEVVPPDRLPTVVRSSRVKYSIQYNTVILVLVLVESSLHTQEANFPPYPANSVPPEKLIWPQSYEVAA